MTEDCAKLALAQAKQLHERAQKAWDDGHGRGTSRLPADVKWRHLQEFYNCRFAAIEFRLFASSIRKQRRKKVSL